MSALTLSTIVKQQHTNCIYPYDFFIVKDFMVNNNTKSNWSAHLSYIFNFFLYLQTLNVQSFVKKVPSDHEVISKSHVCYFSINGKLFLPYK